MARANTLIASQQQPNWPMGYQCGAVKRRIRLAAERGEMRGGVEKNLTDYADDGFMEKI